MNLHPTYLLCHFNRLHHGMFLTELQKSAGLHRHSSSLEYNGSRYVAFGVRFRRPDHHNAQWNRWGMSICYAHNWKVCLRDLTRCSRTLVPMISIILSTHTMSLLLIWFIGKTLLRANYSYELYPASGWHSLSGHARILATDVSYRTCDGEADGPSQGGTRRGIRCDIKDLLCERRGWCKP